MPAPRAVLIDIAKNNLDPTKPHSSMTKDGKLRSTSQLKKVAKVEKKVVEQQKEEVVQPSIVTEPLPEPVVLPTQESKVELGVDEKKVVKPSKKKQESDAS